jgi:succinate dehydrogenase / fumarate reductase cytochrome b subunit
MSVYRWTLTMTMSIVHRATGIALYFGMLLLAAWFAAAALGPAALDTVHAVFASWFGQLVLFGLTWSLFHHALGGLRHFVWDTGNGFSPAGREWLVRFNLIGSIVLTLVVWAACVWF